MHHALLGDFRDVEISQFDHTGFCEEEVGAFDVSVADFEVVQGFESPHGLNEEMPDLLLGVLCLVFLVFLDSLEQITVVTDFHDYAEVARLILKEGLLVANDIWMVDGSENSDFV